MWFRFLVTLLSMCVHSAEADHINHRVLFLFVDKTNSLRPSKQLSEAVVL